jgi:hypothetical protein
MLRYNTRFEDNYNAARSLVARRILNSSLTGCIGYPTTDPAQNGALIRLQALLKGEEVQASWSFVDIEFRKADTNCSLEVKLESVDRADFSDHTDKQGNEWNVYELSTKVNYPCHGSADSATVLARVNLYQQVAMLAAEIQAEFKDKYVMKMRRSAEEVAAAKVEAEKEKLQRKLNILVDANRKNMRVGSELRLGSLVADIPAGRYEVELWNNGRVGVGEPKKYLLNVVATTELGMVENDGLLIRLS